MAVSGVTADKYRKLNAHDIKNKFQVLSLSRSTMLSDEDNVMLSKVPSDVRPELGKHLEDKNQEMQAMRQELEAMRQEMQATRQEMQAMRQEMQAMRQDSLRTVKLAEEAVLSACGRLMRSGRSDLIDDQMSSQLAALLDARKRLEHEVHGPFMGTVQDQASSTNIEQDRFKQGFSIGRCERDLECSLRSGADGCTNHPQMDRNCTAAAGKCASDVSATMTRSCHQAIIRCHLLIGLQDAIEVKV